MTCTLRGSSSCSRSRWSCYRGRARRRSRSRFRSASTTASAGTCPSACGRERRRALRVDAVDGERAGGAVAGGHADAVVPLLAVDAVERLLRRRTGERGSDRSHTAAPAGGRRAARRHDRRRPTPTSPRRAVSRASGSSAPPRPADPLPGPALAWGALDAVLLDAAAAARVSDGQLETLLARRHRRRRPRRRATGGRLAVAAAGGVVGAAARRVAAAVRRRRSPDRYAAARARPPALAAGFAPRDRPRPRGFALAVAGGVVAVARSRRRVGRVGRRCSALAGGRRDRGVERHAGRRRPRSGATRHAVERVAGGSTIATSQHAARRRRRGPHPIRRTLDVPRRPGRSSSRPATRATSDLTLDCDARRHARTRSSAKLQTRARRSLFARPLARVDLRRHASPSTGNSTRSPAQMTTAPIRSNRMPAPHHPRDRHQPRAEHDRVRRRRDRQHEPVARPEAHAQRRRDRADAHPLRRSRSRSGRASWRRRCCSSSRDRTMPSTIIAAVRPHTPCPPAWPTAQSPSALATPVSNISSPSASPPPNSSSVPQSMLDGLAATSA